MNHEAYFLMFHVSSLMFHEAKSVSLFKVRFFIYKMKKNIKLKKNITLDDLAKMVNSGFEEMNIKFSKVDKKFDLLEYEMNKRFDQLEEIIFHEYKNRIERLEDQFKELQADFRQLVSFKK
ncbi:MAG: hypothetical protein Q8N22_01265 [bacterium]|nr:hypothetical protein [bacterium]